MKPFVIVVDGLIAAGKSHLISECLVPRLNKMGYKTVGVLEPVEEWQRSGILEKFYGDPSRYGFQFQTFAFHSRVRSCQHAAEEVDVDFYILERSVFTDRIFMSMLLDSSTIEQHEYDTYMDLWTMRRENMPFGIDMFIYLRPSISEVMRRLKVRSRSEEGGVSLQYQIDLLKKHDDFLMHETVVHGDDDIVGTPILILDTDDNFINDSSVQDGIVRKVLDRANETRNKDTSILPFSFIVAVFGQFLILAFIVFSSIWFHLPDTD